MQFDFDELNGPTGYQIGSYKCLDQIGQGAFGKVYQAISVNDPSLVVALKVVSKRKIQQIKDPEVRKIRRKLMKTEVEIMRKLKCEHIIKCFDIYQNENHLIIALQYCEGGELRDEIQKRGKIPEDQAIRILKQIIIGFAEMHKHNIIHRDLKSQNILKHNEKYKIADFGMSKIISGLHDISFGTGLGNLMTMAPEVLNQKKYGIKADIWSLGVVFYEMVFGKPPYSGFTAQSMAFSIRTQQLDFSACSKDAAHLLSRMLVADPDERISWGELYRQPILYKYSQSTILTEYQEDVELEQSRQFHTEFEKTEKENCMLEEIAAHQKRTESMYEAPKFKKMRNQDLHKSADLARLLINQCQMFKAYVDRLNFERQRSSILLDQIISVLDDEKIKIEKDRELFQLLFLMSSRCLFTASPINDALKREANIFNWEWYKEFLKSSWCASFIKDFRDHYEVVNHRHLKIEKELFDQDNKTKYRFSDFFRKITDRSAYKSNVRFLCGIEGVDYTKDDQIRFTISEYYQRFCQKIKALKPQGDQQAAALNKFRYYLGKYYHIVTANFTEDKFGLRRITQDWRSQL